MKIYAAVIEWGEDYADHEPALILTRFKDHRYAAVESEVHDFLAAIDPGEFPELRDALASEEAYGAPTLDDWWQILSDHDAPAFLTTYEREV